MTLFEPKTLFEWSNGTNFENRESTEIAGNSVKNCLFRPSKHQNSVIFIDIYLKLCTHMHLTHMTCEVHMYTKFQVDVLKNVRVLVYEGVNSDISRSSLEFVYFPYFYILSYLGLSKCVLGSFFRFLTNK